MVDATRSLPVPSETAMPVLSTFASAFRTFGRAPLLFLGLSLVAAFPTFVYLIALRPQSTDFTIASTVLALVNVLLLSFLQIPMIAVASKIIENEPYSLGATFGLAGRRYLPVLGASILVLLLIYGGLILLIVPGLILACVYAVVLPVCALEGLGPIASLKRSAALTKHHRWRILGLYTLFFLPLMIVSGGLTILLAMRGQVLLSQWLSELLQLVWIPLAAIFPVAIYTALRRMKEGSGVAAVFE